MQRAAIANTCRRILLGQAFAARGFANRAAPSVTGAPIYLTRAQQKQQPHQKHTQYRTYASSSRGQEIASTAGNLLIVSSVVGMFGYIVYVLYDNMFAEHGVTRVYNESLDLIRANPQVTELLGGTISGFGEPTHSQRQRQRSIAHREFIDPQGRKRLSMKYYIEDAHHLAPYLGVAKVDLAESPGTKSWDFNYVVVDMYAKQNGVVSGEPIGRIEVLLTEEFAKEVREFQNKTRNRRFSADTKGSNDGSWFSVLHPSNWRK